jgi:hypothetical protein
MSNDQELLNLVRGAMMAALPDDTPSDVIEDAVQSVMQALHAPWFPVAEKRVIGAKNVHLRAAGSGIAPSIGTVAQGTAVRAGQPEKGWVPVLVHGWVSGEMLG